MHENCIFLSDHIADLSLEPAAVTREIQTIVSFDRTDDLTITEFSVEIEKEVLCQALPVTGGILSRSFTEEVVVSGGYRLFIYEEPIILANGGNEENAQRYTLQARVRVYYSTLDGTSDFNLVSIQPLELYDTDLLYVTVPFEIE